MTYRLKLSQKATPSEKKTITIHYWSCKNNSDLSIYEPYQMFNFYLKFLFASLYLQTKRMNVSSMLNLKGFIVEKNLCVKSFITT